MINYDDGRATVRQSSFHLPPDHLSHVPSRLHTLMEISGIAYRDLPNEDALQNGNITHGR